MIWVLISGSVLQSTYSQTSTLLNVDIQSLSSSAISKYYGYIEVGMTLVGKNSGAQARITNIRLVSNEDGILQGCIYIPEPNKLNKKLLNWTKILSD